MELSLWQRQLCLPAMMRPRSRGGSWLRAARSDRVDTVARGLIAGPANLGSATGPVRGGDAQPHAAGPPGVGPCGTRQAAGVHGHSVRRSCRACESGSRAMPAGPDSSRRWYGRPHPVQSTLRKASGVPLAGCRRRSHPVNAKTPPTRVGGAPDIGVADGTRTRDSQDHNLVLYQLNYSHHRRFAFRRTRPVDTNRSGAVKPNRYPPSCSTEGRARRQSRRYRW